MRIIELIMIGILFSLIVIASVSDIKYGIVKNVLVGVFGVTAVLFDIIYYVWNPHYLQTFVINFVIIIVITGMLYFTSVFAAGDCKFVLVSSALFPSGLYVQINNSKFTLFLLLACAFVVGYIYLLISAIITAINEKSIISRKRFIENLAVFAQSYFVMVVYISFINIILTCVIARFFQIPTILFSAFILLSALLVAKFSVLRNKIVIIVCCTIDVALAFVFKFIPLSISWYNYAVLIFFVILRIFLSDYSYKTIKTSQVKKGMILSSATTIRFAKSKVNGLPPVSTEDMKSRLTEEQAESVRRWGTSKYGESQISIVRKIPFVIFVSIGIIIYTTIGVIQNVNTPVGI